MHRTASTLTLRRRRRLWLLGAVLAIPALFVTPLLFALKLPF